MIWNDYKTIIDRNIKYCAVISIISIPRIMICV
jgi:hypothetical protein